MHVLLLDSGRAVSSGGVEMVVKIVRIIVIIVIKLEVLMILMTMIILIIMKIFLRVVIIMPAHLLLQLE